MTQAADRASIDPRYTWNLAALFSTPDAWEAELQAVEAAVDALTAHAGTLGTSGASLLAYLRAADDVTVRMRRVYYYGYLGTALDTRDQTARGRAARVAGLPARAASAAAFFEPEFLALGEARVRELVRDEPDLALYGALFQRIEERRAHVRSAEVEAVLGQALLPFDGTGRAYESLTDSDLQFAPVRTPAGEVPVSQSTVMRLWNDPDRSVRRAAFESFADAYLAHRNTLADLYVTRVKQASFNARVRGYPSSAAGVLGEKRSSMAALQAVVEGFQANAPVWHRYFEVRRRALGVERLGPEDVHAPLARGARAIPYGEATEMILASVAPLGEEYAQTLRRGLEEGRWVDVFPAEGKPAAQFSAGMEAQPFVLMSYSGTFPSVGVLAHELGHAMHQVSFNAAQPPVYHDMGSLECEVPSNFGQMLLRAHLLAQESDPELQLAVLDEGFANFYRYFFQMPLLARFELAVHDAVDRGEGLTADRLSDIMAALLREGFGPDVEVDERAAMMWAQFGHLYSPFYTFEYTVGISCAAALSEGVLAGEPGARDHYLAFLRAGTSLPSLEALKLAGVDLSTPEPIERGFRTLGRMVDQLERLLDARGS